MLDLDGDGTFGDEARDQVEVLGTAVDLAGPRKRAAGRLDIVNIADVLSGTVAFAFEQQEVDVHSASGDLTGAVLTTFALLILADDGDDANGAELGLRIGEAEGVHFSVESGVLLYASIKPAAPAAGDTRVFTAITASLANAELAGIDGLTAQIVSLSVDVNQAAGALAGVNAEALDWTTDVALDGTFEAPVFQVPTGGAPVELTIAYTEDVLGASGRFVIDLFGFVTGDVDFTYASTTEDVAVSDTETLTGAQITRLALRVHSLFVGVPEGPGFRITGGTLVLATVKPSQGRHRDRQAVVARARRDAGVGRVRGHPGRRADVHGRDARDQPRERPERRRAARRARLDHRVRRRRRVRGHRPRRRGAPDRVRGRGVLPPGHRRVQRVRLPRRHRPHHGRQGGRGRRPRRRRRRRPHRRAAADDRGRDQPRRRRPRCSSASTASASSSSRARSSSPR